jgi:hypothetical protein
MVNAAAGADEAVMARLPLEATDRAGDRETLVAADVAQRR